VPLTVAAA